MKKIMFSDKFGLTAAVLQGRKTMTRRMVKDGTPLGNWGETEKYAKYKIGEVVAVAQSYECMANSGYLDRMMETSSTFKKEYCGAGWNNKMFVRADLMPHQIRITDIKVERLRDISEEDCLREGLIKVPDGFIPEEYFYTYCGADIGFAYAKTAFADLIDKVSGYGTWERNPWVFVYSFELIM